MRRDFELDKHDEAFLNTRDYYWETIQEGNRLWVFVREYPLPGGYNVLNATLAIEITSIDYLRSGLDMVYFSPILHRKDGILIGATEHIETITGISFQRWSRHRTAEGSWEVGNDSLVTHLLLVDYWLGREFSERVTV
jgi:hypothetical protein